MPSVSIYKIYMIYTENSNADLRTDKYRPPPKPSQPFQLAFVQLNLTRV